MDKCLIYSQSPLLIFSLFFRLKEMVRLPKVVKPDNVESWNSLKPSLTNSRGLHSNFVSYESLAWIKFFSYSCFKWDKLEKAN